MAEKSTKQKVEDALENVEDAVEELEEVTAELIDAADDLPADPPPAGVPTLNPGDRGPLVERLQMLLGIAITGHYDVRTKNAVRRYQSRKGLDINGRVTVETSLSLGL